MTRAIIVDDEKNALDVLRMQLNAYCPEIEIVAVSLGGKHGITDIMLHKPDLVFMDIEMPLINGFDVLEATRLLNYKVIFTTAYDQFAIKAFKYSAVDYLLKPIDIEELKSAVKKMIHNEQKDLVSILQNMYQHFNQGASHQKKIALPFGDGFEMIAVQNIVRCESESNYTTIFLNDKRKVVLTRTLKDIEEQLPFPPFFRIHNSHIVNVDCIQKWYKTDGGYVIMNDGVQINISRSRKEAFFESMLKL